MEEAEEVAGKALLAREVTTTRAKGRVFIESRVVSSKRTVFFCISFVFVL